VSIALGIGLAVGLSAVVLGSRDSPEPPGVTGGAPSQDEPTTAAGRTTEPEPTIRSLRTCWNGSTVAPDSRCPVPHAERGMALVSPTFTAARRDGRCRPSPDDHTAGGYLCTVKGVVLHFAWFASIAKLDEHFGGIYPRCRPLRDVELCQGPHRAALRYADERFLFEVTALRRDRAVLRGVRLRSAEALLRGRAG
jgi:hypothetical protein